MRDSRLKSCVRRSLFPDGVVRHIAFGPLRGMRYRVSSITGMEAWYSGHERALQNALKRLVCKGDTVIDVGTNWGCHALYLSKLVGEAGKVIAIEPAPEVAAEARWHIHANARGNIELLEVALANEEGTAVLDETGLTTTARLVANRDDEGLAGVKVTVTTIDRIVVEHCVDEPRLVKVDVEGAESSVLAGGVETLRRIRPNLVVELHSPEQDIAVANAIRGAGYVLRRLDGARIDHPDQGWPDPDGVWGIILATPN